MNISIVNHSTKAFKLNPMQQALPSAQNAFETHRHLVSRFAVQPGLHPPEAKSKSKPTPKPRPSKILDLYDLDGMV